MSLKALLIIDPQNSFIDTPHNPGSLAVPGAYQDMLRLAQRVKMAPKDYDDIFVTMDTHKLHDIAHPDWWCDPQGLPPPPFTLISVAEVENGTWRARKEEEQDWSLSYVKSLEAANKYKLCIWPPHCLDGTEGWQVNTELKNALNFWEEETGNLVIYVKKGENPHTEHYSGFKAEVIISDAPETAFNEALAKKLLSYKTVEVAGEALSHCVASSVDDLMEHKQQTTSITNIILLANCMTSVPGFEAQGAAFLNRAAEQGAILEHAQPIHLKNTSARSLIYGNK